MGKSRHERVCTVPLKEQNWQTVNFGGTSVIKKHYYSWQDIEDMCTNIVKQMYADNWRPDYIVGLTRGGNIPQQLTQYVRYSREAMKVSFRNDDRVDKDHWSQKVMEENILIVDDINDTGATFEWILG